MKKFSMVQSLVLILATAVVLVGPLARGPADAQTAQQDRVEVTLSMYSGRPDPRFQLREGKDLDELRARLKSAIRQVDVPRNGVLGPTLQGYRGVVVTSGRDVFGLPARIAMFNQTIELVSGDQREYVADEGRALERYLIDLALEYKAVDQSLHAAIVAQLTSQP